MFDFRKNIRFSLKLIWSLQGHQQNRSLGTDPICSVEPRLHLTILSIVIRVLNTGCQTSQTSVTSLCPFCDCATKRVYGSKNVKSTNSANYKRFKTIWERTSDNSPTVPSSSFLKWWSSKQGLCLLFASSQSFHALPNMSFHVVRPRDSFAWGFSHPGNFFSCGPRNSWFEHLVVLVNNSFVGFTFTSGASEIYIIKKWCWFVKINKFHQFLPRGSHILPSSHHFDVIHEYRQEQSFFWVNKKTFPVWYFFPSKSQWNFLKISFLQEASKRLTLQISYERNYWVFSVWPRFGPRVSSKTYPKIWTSWLWNFKLRWCIFSDFGVVNNLGASSIFSWV